MTNSNYKRLDIDDGSNYKRLDIDDGNGHEWFEIIKKPLFLVGKTVCKQCGYMRRIDENGKPLNKDCKGPVKVTLR